LRDNLVMLREKCYRVTSCHLYFIDHTQTYTLTEFCKRQEAQKDSIANLLETFSEKVSEIVYSACEEALREFLDHNGFSAMPAKDNGSSSIGHDHSLSGGHSAFLDMPTAGSHSSPREITFTERAAMRTQCRKLTKYVRLADFFVVDAFLSLAIGSTESFLQYIQDAKASSDNHNEDMSSKSASRSGQPSMTNHSPRRTASNMDDRSKKTITCPLFQVEMQFDDKAEGVLEFLPKDDDFKVRLESVIFDALKVVTCPQRLLTHVLFRPFVQPSIDEQGPLGDGIDLEMMIVEDRHFQKMVEDINENVTEAFERAEDYAEIFNPFRDKYLDNCHFLHSTEDFGSYREKSVEDLKSLIAQYRAQQAEFEGIPDISDVGIIRINSHKLNQQFKPSPTICLERLYKLVPNIASEKTQELLDQLSRSLEEIGSVPNSVEDFVKLMSHLATATEDIPELDHKYFFLQDMFHLLDEYEVEVSDYDKTNQFMLTQTQSQLKTCMQLTEDSVEENTQRFSKELDENIPKLHAKVAEIRQNLDKPLLRSVESEISVVLKYIAKCQAEVDEQVALAKKYCYYQEVLKVRVSTFDDLDELKGDMNLKSKFWHALNSFSDLTKSWTDTPFADVDTATLEREVQQYYKTSIQSERGLPGNMAVPKLRAMVEDFKAILPVVINLGNAALKERHWDVVHAALGFDVNGVEGFTLGELIDNRAMDAAEVIGRVTTEAMQESVLEKMLSKVQATWEESDFELNMYKEQRDVFILGGVDDIIASLDDSLVTLNTIMSSRFVKAILEEVESWQKKLALFQETLDEWMTCQRNWMYLETIFSAPDIQRQLPNESKLFFNVDSSWKDIMKRTNENPNCLKAGTHVGLLETFVKHNAALDKIQKSLEDYLETKRMAFPRFYFLSNDELLEILAQTKDPQAVQPHLRKCFDNLVRLDFGDQPGSSDILAMMSGEGEKVPLGRNLKARGNVEDWLTAVQHNMQTSLHKAMKACLSEYSAEARGTWVLQHPGQCIASCAQMAWANGCEEVLLSDDNPVAEMGEWLQQNIRQLSELTVLVRSNLTKLQRKVIVALVTTDVHARDIVDELYTEAVDRITNFKWQQQLRYYWEKDLDDVLVRQSNSAIHYGYEYMGATSRLVITPLTDRCWMTITGSFDLKLGASPAGPAGTGKTESSKDLAKALAIQCIVFNCSDQIDYKMMAKLFSGLSQCGCWTCLDEFNRIDIEVLSVIAQQLTVLRQARLTDLDRTTFEGRDIKVQDHHVIVTMNPGYAGRTELPDNLKVCFRPVSMMVPDYGLIAEIMLFAEGFEDAKALSRKMTKLYKLSSEQLSQQPHYDFGMRAVKSVLVMAGSLKRSNPAYTLLLHPAYPRHPLLLPYYPITLLLHCTLHPTALHPNTLLPYYPTTLHPTPSL
jgi:dynein heavy chain